MNIPLPPGPIQSPAAWIGRDMVRAPSKWRHDLSANEITSLRNAARTYLAKGHGVADLAQHPIDLGELAPLIEQLRNDMMNGCGVRVLTGLPVADMSRAECAIIFCGLGSKIGNARPQNAA